MAGMSKVRLGELERGASPNLRTARALADALGSDVDTLFPRNDENPAGNGVLDTTAADWARSDVLEA